MAVFQLIFSLSPAGKYHIDVSLGESEKFSVFVQVQQVNVATIGASWSPTFSQLRASYKLDLVCCGLISGNNRKQIQAQVSTLNRRLRAEEDLKHRIAKAEGAD